MITPALHAEIRRLFYAEHWRIDTIATTLGVHHDTVRHAVESERFIRPGRQIRPSALDSFKAFITATLEQYPRLRATRLFEMVRPRGYAGSVVQLRRIVRLLRPQVSPVIYRPLFDHLQLVTCRTFETPAANTIPLLCQERQFVEDVYGPAGLELVLPRERPQEKIIDLFENRQKYLEVVRELRHVLSQRYSYTARVRELVERIGE